MNLGYNRFLLEKSFTNLLLESKIKYFSDFIDIMSSMKSPIAKEILELNGKDIDVPMNYISTTAKDDTIGFFIDNKTKESDFLSKVINPGATYRTFDRLSSKIDGWKGKGELPSEGEMGYIIRKYTIPEISDITGGIPSSDIYHFRSTNGIDYLIAVNGVQEINNHKDGTNPQEVKVGRFANKILQKVGLKFTDKDIETFTNEFKSKIVLSKDKFSKFEEVKGDAIRFWYNEHQYDYTNTSTLHSSCMRYDNCGQFLGIYTANPDVCRLLILKSPNPDLIVARALIWTLTDGTNFMDRIYYSKDSNVDLFKEYAKEHGYCYKKRQISSTDEDILFDDNKLYDKELLVKLENSDFKYYPYVDTVKYLNRNTGTLSNKHIRGKTISLESTEGSTGEDCEVCEGEETVECEECNGSGKIECYECSGRGLINCDDCGGDGDIECSNCDGEGEVEDDEGNMSKCDECNGKGRVDCSNCDSRGEMECSDCEGDGENGCGNCDGEGRVSCPECQ